MRIAFVSLLLLSCGDPLVEDGYRGEPIFKVRGEVLALPFPAPGEEVTYRASAFWNVAGAGAVELIEQTSVTTEIFLPDVFDVIFFLPPAPEHFQSPGLAVGILLVYADVDRDGRWQEESDRLLAATTAEGFVYAPEPVADHPAGFSLVDLPTTCPEIIGTRDSPAPVIAADRCDATSSCTRALCDPTHHICVPDRPMRLEVSTSFDLMRIACSEE